MNSKYILIFLVSFLLIATPLCIFPINFFPGEVIVDYKGVEYVEYPPLSLSYFFGLGFEEGDFDEYEGKRVLSYRLTKQGWGLVVSILLLLPALITYRVYLQGNKTK